MYKMKCIRITVNENPNLQYSNKWAFLLKHQIIRSSSISNNYHIFKDRTNINCFSRNPQEHEYDVKISMIFLLVKKITRISNTTVVCCLHPGLKEMINFIQRLMKIQVNFFFLSKFKTLVLVPIWM